MPPPPERPAPYPSPYPSPYAAALRVYEPLAAFSEPEARAWADYAGTRRGAPPRTLIGAEIRAALASVTGTPPRAAPPQEPREAYLLETEAGVHVCPWQIRLRSWQAIDEFRTGLPPAIVDAFLPPAVVEEAQEDHRRWRLRNPEARTHIRTSRWYVPVEWFALVEPDQRERRATPRALVYRTPMADARRRAARARRTLQRALGADELTTSVEDVGRWLEEFHPRSQVEIDYGGLVLLLDDEALEADTSPADVAAALAALAAGDEAAATTAYQRLVDRWRSVQELEHAS